MPQEHSDHLIGLGSRPKFRSSFATRHCCRAVIGIKCVRILESLLHQQQTATILNIGTAADRCWMDRPPTATTDEEGP